MKTLKMTINFYINWVLLIQCVFHIQKEKSNQDLMLW